MGTCDKRGELPYALLVASAHAAHAQTGKRFSPLEPGALAALTGFVVVAISINLSRILAYVVASGPGGRGVGPDQSAPSPRRASFSSPSRSAKPASGFRNHLGGACDGRDADCLVQARSWRARAGRDRDPTRDAGRHERGLRIGLRRRGALLFAGAQPAFLGRCRRCRVPRRGGLQSAWRLPDDRNSTLEACGERLRAVLRDPRLDASAAVRLGRIRSSAA